MTVEPLTLAKRAVVDDHPDVRLGRVEHVSDRAMPRNGQVGQRSRSLGPHRHRTGAPPYRLTDISRWRVEAVIEAAYSSATTRSTVGDRAPGGDFDYRSCETDVFDGGITATAPDLARFGATLLAGGVAPTGERMVSTLRMFDAVADHLRA